MSDFHFVLSTLPYVPTTTNRAGRLVSL